MLSLEVRSEREIPGATKLLRAGAIAQLVSAFAALTGRTAGARDRFGRGEDFDEADLPLGSPAVVAGLQFNRREAEARMQTSHPPA